VSIDKKIKIPVIAKASILLIALFVLFSILYIAQGIIIPLIFSTIIAIILHPVVKFFARKGINRVLAIILTLFLTFVVIAGLGVLLYTQISQFAESWPVLVEKFTETLNQTIKWWAGNFDTNPQKINAWIALTKSELINTSGSAIGQTLVSVGGVIVILLLIPVYIFMLLYYEPLLLDFIHKLFGKTNQTQVTEIVSQTKTVIQRYLIGLLIEAAIIGTLYTVTLLILGVDYAVLLGIIGAFLNMIPYIGGIVGAALPMIVALATKSSGWYAFYILITYYIIQLVDNNYIVPKIVASKVKINALFSVIAVIVGNALWGIPGMFLAIPLLAIIKLIFDHIEPLKPYGFLLGDTMPPLLILKPVFKKISKKTI
jgi:predicted PurR-regulated permease PerM